MPVWVPQTAAAVVAVCHLALIVFVVGGGFVAGRHRWVLPLHLATVAAVLAVTAAGAPCPVTEVELWLLRMAGDPGYRGGFIEHYLVRPLHPAGITPPVQVLIQALAVVPNVVAYGHLARHRTPSHA